MSTGCGPRKSASDAGGELLEKTHANNVTVSGVVIDGDGAAPCSGARRT
jgi:hypothetical protein